MKGRVLVVGLCCVDVVNYVQSFPREDSDVRVFSQTTCLGGNSANSCVVLTQFDPRVSLCASLPSDNALLDRLLADSGLDVSRSLRRPHGIDCPQSTVIVNESSGTRTVLHYRGNLPELSATEFEQQFACGFGDFSWVHFEGRNFEHIRAMIAFVRAFQRQHPSDLRISLELEKIRDFRWFDGLVSLVDVVFVSKDFAKSRSWLDGVTAAKSARAEFADPLQQITVVCAWGSEGAYALAPNCTEPLFVPAHRVDAVDTLAAGDCFNAAMIWALNSRLPLQKALETAVLVAGGKCAQRGLLAIPQIADALAHSRFQ